MNLRSRRHRSQLQEEGGHSSDLYIAHPYAPDCVEGSQGRSPFDDDILFRQLLKGCRPAEFGLWTKGKIPVNEVFSFWGRKWMVKTATNPAMGLGLFALQKITVKPSEEECGMQLFVFGEPEYGQADWNKIILKTRFPRIRKYALTANKQTRDWVIAEGKEPPPWKFIDGNTLWQRCRIHKQLEGHKPSCC